MRIRLLPFVAVAALAWIPPLRAQEEPAPPGYRYAHRRWRTLSDGTRDYAIFHGQETFRVQLPVSSRIRSPRRRR